ncbi:MAG TPA: hypothetical protein VHA06_19300 [Candidatus Angelobacter sp.]|nr:hypothetical protein [Candidatus Angelobacter sp.]
MFKLLRSVLLVYLVVNTVNGFAATNTSPAAPSMPVAFEINRGQTAPQVKYMARSREGALFFTDQGMTVAVPHLGAFRMLFENAAVPQITAEDTLVGKSNYLSHQPGTSITGVENYGSLLYSGLYSGIDVRFYGQGRHLEHDFILAPGADSHQIALRMEGISHIALQPSGNLQLTLGKTNLFETAPVAWQMVNGQRKPVQASWQLLGENKLGIQLGKYDRSLPVTIDPVLAYSTHLGGATGQDTDLGFSFPADTFITHIGLDASHNIYVSGTTSAVDYPTTAGAFDRTANLQVVFHEDATTQSGFISKFDPSGKILLYSTFLRDFVEVMWVDSAGDVYSAETTSDEFPGPGDGFDQGMFVDKLSPDGSTQQFTTIYARTDDTAPSSCDTTFTDSRPSGMISDDSGHLYLVGTTINPCLPGVAGTFQATLPNSSQSGFLAKFDTNKAPASSLVYTTYLGGTTDFATPQAVAIDAAGDAYVAGISSAAGFPHNVAFGTAAGSAAFVIKLNPTATGALFSTILKGSNGVRGIAIDSAHSVYIAGSALSGYPTTAGAFQTAVTKTAACTDGFGNAIACTSGYATKLGSTGGTLVFSTLLGGNNADTLSASGLNSAGMMFVTGTTISSNFPTTASAFKKTLPAGATNSFVTAFQPDGKSLYYSTLLGGSKNTEADAIVIDPAWNAWVAGNTTDVDYPVTPDAFQPGLKGNSDGFIAKVVIAGDLRLLMTDNISTVARNAVVTFFDQVTNLGPDVSDNVVFSNPVPAGYSFDKIFTQSATSCTTPAVGATTGTVICKKTQLANGESFWVNVYLRATAASGANVVNKASTSAQTQDLSQGNNNVSLTVHVQ